MVCFEVLPWAVGKNPGGEQLGCRVVRSCVGKGTERLYGTTPWISPGRAMCPKLNYMHLFFVGAFVDDKSIEE